VVDVTSSLKIETSPLLTSAHCELGFLDFTYHMTFQISRHTRSPRLIDHFDVIRDLQVNAVVTALIKRLRIFPQNCTHVPRAIPRLDSDWLLILMELLWSKSISAYFPCFEKKNNRKLMRSSCCLCVLLCSCIPPNFSLRFLCDLCRCCLYVFPVIVAFYMRSLPYHRNVGN
jgi:hypothetical protein